MVGIEIKLSNNHPVSDICDDLKGVYPKTFRWKGWHPNCRCYQVPVLAKQEELDEMLDKILDGDNPATVECEEKVKELPSQLPGGCKTMSNASRMQRRKGLCPTSYGTMKRLSIHRLQRDSESPARSPDGSGSKCHPATVECEKSDLSLW